MTIKAKLFSLFLILAGGLMQFAAFLMVKHESAPAYPLFSLSLFSLLLAGFFAQIDKSVSDKALSLTCAVLSIVNMLVSFAFIYRRSGLIETSCGKCRPVHDAGAAFYFSVVTWTTVGYGDFIPSPDNRFFAASEAFMGQIGFGIFIYLALAFQRELIKNEIENGSSR